jgi:hypothetical protein|tara:strand:- start:362 stop:481 length:120 start_codon:yes stop_codon:yes gene_type:complete
VAKVLPLPKDKLFCAEKVARPVEIEGLLDDIGLPDACSF